MLYRGGKTGTKISHRRWSDTAHVVSELPTARSRDISLHLTSFKSPHSLRPMRARDILYHMPQTFSLLRLSPCFVEGCQQGKNSVALIDVAINFGYKYFCFVIYFSNIFLSKFFVFHFFLKIFLQNFFRTSFQNFFSKGFTLDASLFTETRRTVWICVMKNMIYSKRWKLDFSLVW